MKNQLREQLERTGDTQQASAVWTGQMWRASGREGVYVWGGRGKEHEHRLCTTKIHSSHTIAYTNTQCAKSMLALASRSAHANICSLSLSLSRSLCLSPCVCVCARARACVCVTRVCACSSSKCKEKLKSLFRSLSPYLAFGVSLFPSLHESLSPSLPSLPSSLPPPLSLSLTHTHSLQSTVGKRMDLIAGVHQQVGWGRRRLQPERPETKTPYLALWRVGQV